MRTITITFDTEPYLPALMEKVAVQGQQLEQLKPGSSFLTYFDDQPVAVSMLATPRPMFVVASKSRPCSDEHAMAISDGIPIDCPLCG